jgi:prolyl-tRNA synthetase
MARWVQSWRDLPLLTNQWANVVRWEMRTRMFLRTSEFLWQEGHTAHADRDDAMAEMLRALEMYRVHAEEELAMPVVAGEKPENERFPGAVATYSIEAMMQDGKALQAGTSHYLGTGFAESAGIRYQDREGTQQLCHTTSWGVSTRLIGGVIMTHGDDDGLRVPPAIAPQQIVILPMIKDQKVHMGSGHYGHGHMQDSDGELLEYCERLRAALANKTALGEPVRVLLDKKPGRVTDKRWGWVKKGVPLILEIGARDAADSKVSWVRRDRLYISEQDRMRAFGGAPPQFDMSVGKVIFSSHSFDDFVGAASDLLESIQRSLYAEATARRDANIHRDITSLDALAAFFDDKQRYPGWVELGWSRPSGAELEGVVAKLKALKLTIRNTPMDNRPVSGECLFTGKPAVKRIFVARAY